MLRQAKAPLIAVVRLRKRNEWVLPKGKLDDGETPRDAAEREVNEETGHDVIVHEFLGTLVYESGGRSQVVHYWRMQADGGWTGTTAGLARRFFAGADLVAGAHRRLQPLLTPARTVVPINTSEPPSDLNCRRESKARDVLFSPTAPIGWLHPEARSPTDKTMLLEMCSRT